jgi:putative hydrolase of the HAD superfamily
MESYSTTKNFLIDLIGRLSGPMELAYTGEKPVLKTLSGIKCVVFDFYGTMFISGTGDTVIEAPKESRKKAFQEAFETVFPGLSDLDSAKGVEAYQAAIQRHKQQLQDNGIDFPEINILEIWRDVLSQLRSTTNGLPEEPGKKLLKQLTVEFEMRDNPTWPMPDLEATIESLHDSGFLLGILSNSQFYTPLIYEAHLGAPPSKDRFDINICIWSYQEQRCKPSLAFHGELKRALSDHHKIQPSEVLFVGNDMLKDIYPAVHHGFKTALFAGDARSLKWRAEDERCKNIKPDLVITRLHQLTECLSVPSSSENSLQ